MALGDRVAAAAAVRRARQYNKNMFMTAARGGGPERVLRAVNLALTQGLQWMADLGLSYPLDEVAILAPAAAGQDYFEHMLGLVGQQGITYFNTSSDKVECRPLPSKYDVRYDFFTTNLGVRIELMRLESGYSPLHQLYRDTALREVAVQGMVVHVSFKVPDEAQLYAVFAALSAAGWLEGQRCTSSYGQFGYWRPPNEDGPLLWLKPRVNIRDMPPVEHAVVTPEEAAEEAVGREIEEEDPEFDEEDEERF